MASIEVPPLAEYLAGMPEFRQARGRRHPLLAVLLLAGVARRGGARAERAIADWATDHPAWRERLGFTHPRGPRPFPTGAGTTWGTT